VEDLVSTPTKAAMNSRRVRPEFGVRSARTPSAWKRKADRPAGDQVGILVRQPYDDADRAEHAWPLRS
jgi:hypothetical protein